jgi:hypothetical protein
MPMSGQFKAWSVEECTVPFSSFYIYTVHYYQCIVTVTRIQSVLAYCSTQRFETNVLGVTLCCLNFLWCESHLHAVKSYMGG